MASPALSGTESHGNGPLFSLETILGNDHEKLEHPDVRPEGWDEEATEREVAHGYCVECEDQPAEVRCDTCTDDYCEVCFAAQHRKGSRKMHTAKSLAVGEKAPSNPSPSQNGLSHAKFNGQDVEMEDSEEEGDVNTTSPPAPISDIVLSSQPALGSEPGEWFVERAKYIPLRLALGERKFLRLLDAALQVSEYTDKIDTLGFGLSKAKRIVHQIRELCAILSGLVLAADYKQGQELFTDRDFVSNSDFYQKVFELGRRHKIMNPDKMRTTYGKLIYLLQDSQTPEVREILGFSCVSPIKTVHGLLEDHGVLDLLRDPLITTATQEIVADRRNRREIQRDIKAKERAIETLSIKYCKEPKLPQEVVRQALYSIGDNHAFLRTNRDPCDRMIGYLQQYFHPTQVRDKKGADSLAIRSGRGGARLSHDHAKQYAYVVQSLALWREILHDMFHLWSLAEQDLLSETVPYRLRDTGQGLNRVQASPKTSRMMHSLGGWVGSSVIHMGDHNVPNALMFIDKYSQIYRILLPICNTLLHLPTLYNSPALRAYIDAEYGSLDALYLNILGDFFRHAFDGSGADNFYDAGSCIDGRLTSAWNWCSSLEKKGFNGFDGEW
ncbi:hypothetical protein B0F90DRAFT_1811346 [Multifurca ochricompacta]|uniref:B box-type domain-containing protein n=1 Tax=Multifurca ochricompacta TaxID=376703 RepID=A0AAD4LZW6_9AGAM|nr:hypothetical protein B0F90DRAFT_1811346 [Multifurca ochricompacta]